MGKQRNYFWYKLKKGQSTVEYIMLLVVITLIVSTVYRSDAFKKFFGEESEFFNVMAYQMVYSYCNGKSPKDDAEVDLMTCQKRDYRQAGAHESYVKTEAEDDTDTGRVGDDAFRFFVPAFQYPRQ